MTGSPKKMDTTALEHRARLAGSALVNGHERANAPDGLQPETFSTDPNNEDHLREILWHKEQQLAQLDAEVEHLEEERKVLLDQQQLGERAAGKTQWEAERLGRTSQAFRDHLETLNITRRRAKMLRADCRHLERRYRAIERHQANTRADMWRHK